MDAVGFATDLVACLNRIGRTELILDVRGSEHTSHWFHNVEKANEFVVYVTDPQPTAWTKLCLRQADSLLLLAQAGNPPEWVHTDATVTYQWFSSADGFTTAIGSGATYTVLEGDESFTLKAVATATDVTGYGLIGHLISLCRASRVSGKINQAAVPMISEEIGELIELGCVPQGSRDNLNSATVLVDWASTDDARKILLTDAQTSGGLLLCVAEVNFKKVIALLRKVGTASAALIGEIAPRRRRRPLICMTE